LNVADLTGLRADPLPFKTIHYPYLYSLAESFYFSHNYLCGIYISTVGWNPKARCIYTFNPSPTLPKEVEIAALSGQLVTFVGAGVSRLVQCPSWEDFADKILEQLAPEV
jgi:hypothetical protein